MSGPADRGPRRPSGERDRRGSGSRLPRGGRPLVDAARQAAYETVVAVHRDDAYANLALPRILRELRLHGRDAAFATELTYGTLRWSGTLDAIIAVAADREVARIDPPARDALRLGAYQLLHMRVSPHAAVSSTVDLVRAVAGPSATGFANAVLRRITAKPWDGWIADVAPDRDADPLGYLAVAYAHPLWIVRAFAEALGGDRIIEQMAADNLPAPVHLCARPGRVERDALAKEVGGEPGRYSPFAVYLPGGAPGDLPAVADGRAHVQDEGSQLVALALAQAPLAGPDRRWLDLCAGPGGKAALLGALAAQRGAEVTAVEVAPHRAALVEQAVAGLPVTVEVADGREIEQTRFDRVLVDAPCSGLGALRRRPESRWRRAGRSRAGVAAVAAPARYRRDVPRIPAQCGLTKAPYTVGRERRVADRCPEPACRRLLPPGRGGPGRGGQRRLAARRRDGQPLRPEPHHRAARRAQPQVGDHAAARRPPDDRRAGPLGGRVRRSRLVQRQLPCRGGRGPGGAGQGRAGRREPGRPRDRPGHAGRAVPGPAAALRHPADHDDQGRFRRPEVPPGAAGEGAYRPAAPAHRPSGAADRGRRRGQRGDRRGSRRGRGGRVRRRYRRLRRRRPGRRGTRPAPHGRDG